MWEVDNYNRREILNSKKSIFQGLFHDFTPPPMLSTLLLHTYPLLCAKTVFTAGRGDNKRDLDIGQAYEMLGSEKCQTLLGFHAFTGCDETGKFNGHSKTSCWNTFMSSSKQVLSAFTNLELMCFVLDLYQTYRPADIDTLAKLKWYMFSKKQLESEKLPPTNSAFMYVVHRSHFMFGKQLQIALLIYLTQKLMAGK